MKRILLTETQLLRLTKSLVRENIIHNGHNINYNPDGTINVNKIKIRLLHTQNPLDLFNKGPWEINIVKLNKQDKGLDFETKKGKKGLIPIKVLDDLINYVNSNDRNNKLLMNGGLAGDILAKKV
jgi:hypothetical protein